MTEAQLAEKFAELLLLARSNQLPLESLRRWALNARFAHSPSDRQLESLAQEVVIRLSDQWPLQRLLGELDLWWMQAEAIAYFAGEDPALCLVRNEIDVDRLMSLAGGFHDCHVEEIRYLRQTELARTVPATCARSSGLEECRIRLSGGWPGVSPLEVVAVGIVGIQILPGWDSWIFESTMEFRDGALDWNAVRFSLSARAVAWREAGLSGLGLHT